MFENQDCWLESGLRSRFCTNVGALCPKTTCRHRNASSPITRWDGTCRIRRKYGRVRRIRWTVEGAYRTILIVCIRNPDFERRWVSIGCSGRPYFYTGIDHKIWGGRIYRNGRIIPKEDIGVWSRGHDTGGFHTPMLLPGSSLSINFRQLFV